MKTEFYLYLIKEWKNKTNFTAGATCLFPTSLPWTQSAPSSGTNPVLCIKEKLRSLSPITQMTACRQPGCWSCYNIVPYTPDAINVARLVPLPKSLSGWFACSLSCSEIGTLLCPYQYSGRLGSWLWITNTTTGPPLPISHHLFEPSCLACSRTACFCYFVRWFSTNKSSVKLTHTVKTWIKYQTMYWYFITSWGKLMTLFMFWNGTQVTCETLVSAPDHIWSSTTTRILNLYSFDEEQ